ncbi:MAG: AAA family ATPase [Gammaproteobacteria bacterium]|jgi:cellulose biosynthesis protein BcsQ|nr:AAA family ATPase [Gammaproteobacteria bacterium]
MKIFATYNIKGGVGKTAAAVNLSYLSGQSGFRTLVWDLDAQGAATFYFRVRPHLKGGGERLIRRKRNLPKAIRATDYHNLDLIPSDFSLRNLDLKLAGTKAPEDRLDKLLGGVKDDYDIAMLDCAPSISLVSENVIHMADWLLIPLIPTQLSLRAYGQLREFFVSEGHNTERLMPFFSMVDKRRRLHKTLIVEFAAQHPELLQTYIPYLSQIEQMGVHRAPVGVFAGKGAGGRAFAGLWQTIMNRTNLAPEPVVSAPHE